MSIYISLHISLFIYIWFLINLKNSRLTHGTWTQWYWNTYQFNHLINLIINAKMNNFHYTLEACRSKNRPSCIININVSRETLSDIFCDIFHYFFKSFQFLNSFQNMIVSRETLLVTSHAILQYFIRAFWQHCVKHVCFTWNIICYFPRWPSIFL